jgi:hypothetical protein
MIALLLLHAYCLTNDFGRDVPYETVSSCDFREPVVTELNATEEIYCCAMCLFIACLRDQHQFRLRAPKRVSNQWKEKLCDIELTLGTEASSRVHGRSTGSDVLDLLQPSTSQDDVDNVPIDASRSLDSAVD